PIVPILLAALVAVVLAVGGVVFVKASGKAEPGPYGLGAIAARSAPARPEWIAPGAAPGQASCSGHGGGLTCVGASMVSPSQADAEDEASDAALEALARELGKRQSDPAWQAAIAPMYL